MIQINGSGVVEPLSAATRRAGASGHHASVKQHRRLQRGGGLEQRVKAVVVGIEGLPARVELGATKSQGTYRALELAHGKLALPWVDTREAHKPIGVFPTRRRELVVRIGGYARRRLGVCSEQHGQHVE